ncbi:MAG TPA: hypothetical protein PK583_04045 [Gammaproteobacteria bacterium]|nr:hypothetical protein [Gammaproteobacteria bacterium]HQZ87648.1 hypothetical protein [Gammaproteobacteria bacterium]HRA42152.1 hypothetical protein [Gammaproteobacteria bacterium]
MKGIKDMKVIKLSSFTAMFLGMAFLTGCAGGLNPERYLLNKQSFMLSEDNPPAYVSGYVDGCSAGRRLAGDKRFVYRKNGARFEKDALYARGWQEGQINCRNEALEEETYIAGRPKGGWRKLENATPDTENRRVQSANHVEEEKMRAMWEELRK